MLVVFLVSLVLLALNGLASSYLLNYSVFSGGAATTTQYYLAFSFSLTTQAASVLGIQLGILTKTAARYLFFCLGVLGIVFSMFVNYNYKTNIDNSVENTQLTESVQYSNHLEKKSKNNELIKLKQQEIKDLKTNYEEEKSTMESSFTKKIKALEYQRDYMSDTWKQKQDTAALIKVEYTNQQSLLNTKASEYKDELKKLNTDLASAIENGKDLTDTTNINTKTTEGFVAGTKLLASSLGVSEEEAQTKVNLWLSMFIELFNVALSVFILNMQTLTPVMEKFKGFNFPKFKPISLEKFKPKTPVITNKIGFSTKDNVPQKQNEPDSKVVNQYLKEMIEDCKMSNSRVCSGMGKLAERSNVTRNQATKITAILERDGLVEIKDGRTHYKGKL